MNRPTRKLPSYPLFTKDPFFSIWSNDELLSTSVTDWRNVQRDLRGYLVVDGITYRFLGVDPRYKALNEIDISVELMATDYVFEQDDFSFRLSFVSPLPLDDVMVLGTPICYLTYSFKSQAKHDIRVLLYIGENLTYEKKNVVRADTVLSEDCSISYIGRDSYNVLSQSVDLDGPDGGFYYLAGPASAHLPADSLLPEGNIKNCYDANKEMGTVTYADHTDINDAHGHFAIGRDGIVDILYYGEPLRSVCFKKHRSFISAMDSAYKNIAKILNKVETFEKKVKEDAKEYPVDYWHILLASYRQSVSGHKLVMDEKGRTLFLSKENGSDGCIATVDVTFPSSPLYALYNPKLLEGMLIPVMDLVQFPSWDLPYAPHDCGVYPFCLGQFYGVKTNPELGYLNSVSSVLPPFYAYPSMKAIIDDKRQMPVEECGNLLILSLLLALTEDDDSFIRRYEATLAEWCDYLLKRPTLPSNQLCTDDFAGLSDKNVNLAIKMAIGIASFGKIEELLGKDGSDYINNAKARAKEIESLSLDGYIPMSGENGDKRYSVKYNLYMDKLVGTNLFKEKTYVNELAKYETKFLEFGLPLDDRSSWAKSDWQIWISSLAKKENKGHYYSTIVKYLKESTMRVPFGDWLDAKEGNPARYGEHKELYFVNRTVVGGVFAPILLDKMNKGKGE